LAEAEAELKIYKSETKKDSIQVKPTSKWGEKIINITNKKIWYE
jgi:hypothetical protein